MGRKPSLQTDEAREIEAIKQVAGYGLICVGIVGFVWMKAVYTGKAHPAAMIVTFGSLGAGLLIHVSRQAFREAQKIRLPQRRRYPPPPIENQVAGGAPTEIQVGAYQVKINPTESEESRNS
jgi:hypothetical protein